MPWTIENLSMARAETRPSKSVSSGAIWRAILARQQPGQCRIGELGPTSF